MIVDLRDIATRESEQVEWKENVADVNDVVRTLVAFANDLANLGGGRVVCGAAEGKDADGFPEVVLTGLTATRLKEVEGQVMARCRDHVNPSLAPLVHELPGASSDRRVLVFTIIATGKAHAFRDGAATKYWVRLSRDTREARNGLLMRLLAAKGEIEPWDRRVCADATTDDLDLLALRETLVQMGSWDPSRPIDDWLDPNVTLSAFIPSLCGREALTGVVRPRNFAILLFGRAPQRFVPGAVSVFSIYPGTDRTEPYSERLDLDGTLISQVRRLIERLNVEAVTVMDKSSGEPANVVKFPHRALQEAVVNALVHRDYTEVDPVRVVAFADRIDIWSPGGLDSKLEPAAFASGQARPVWRNQALAWVFVKLRLAQSEGQGIPTIFTTMAHEGCPAPRFEVTDTSVACILPAHPRHARMRELSRIERDISLGRVAEATTALGRLLSDDPFNFRTIALLAELARSTSDNNAIVRFVEQHRDVLHRFPTAAQLALADALSTTGRGGSLPPQQVALVRELLHLAGQSRMEIVDARRLVIAHSVLHDDKAAFDAADRALRDHPTDPSLLQLRGRALLQHAKRCSETLRGNRLSPRLRANAVRDLRSFIDRAEHDLRASIEHGASAAVRDFASDDLAFASKLRGWNRLN